MAVGLGAIVGVGDTADGVGDGAGVVIGVAVGVATGVADGAGEGDGFGVGEGFAAIIIPGNPSKRQAIKASRRGAIWLLFFDGIFTII